MVNKDNIKITRKELEVLKLIVKGDNTKEISSVLNISINTVKDYRKILLRKFNVKNCAELSYKTSKLDLV